MSDGYTRNDCSAERAYIAKLEARIEKLEEKIQCLEALVDCLAREIGCLKKIIAQALLASWELARWLESVLAKMAKVLNRKSGVPRGVWSFAKGSDAVARQALAGVHVIISILNQICPGCDTGGCD